LHSAINCYERAEDFLKNETIDFFHLKLFFFENFETTGSEYKIETNFGIFGQKNIGTDFFVDLEYGCEHKNPSVSPSDGAKRILIREKVRPNIEPSVACSIQGTYTQCL
jgi:hypothetical protein